uniref:Uncharacterized protein n=1 Tax=Anopheles maculatus TaxID=74869 RepID=A0A182SNQ5_9DIPT
MVMFAAVAAAVGVIIASIIVAGFVAICRLKRQKPPEPQEVRKRMRARLAFGRADVQGPLGCLTKGTFAPSTVGAKKSFTTVGRSVQMLSFSWPREQPISLQHFAAVKAPEPSFGGEGTN